MIFSVGSSGAEERSLMQSLKRLALVVGNSTYKIAPLKNPVNDAFDMSACLIKLGFKVDRLLNADKKTIDEAIRRFGKHLKTGGIGLFYYAGHGMQINGKNYLIPVDAHIEKQSDIIYEAVDANRILTEMYQAGNGLNIIILDACRNNPFTRSFRSATVGLAPMDAPNGTYITYATEPGSVAADGEGRNGLFTKHLLKVMQMALPIEQVMKRVRRSVMQATDNRQVPWDASSLTGDFYFNNSKITTTAVLQPLTPGSSDDILPDDHADIWDLPEIMLPNNPPQDKIIIRMAKAVGGTSYEACSKAVTTVARKFFKGKPGPARFKRAVYRMHCNVLQHRLNRIKVEVFIEFYKKEQI